MTEAGRPAGLDEAKLCDHQDRRVPSFRRRQAARSRHMLILLILILAGAWSGQMVSYQIWDGSVSMDSVLECVISIDDPPAGLTEEEQDEQFTKSYSSCIRSKRVKRYGFMIGGAAAVALTGVILAMNLPRRYLRRAGPRRSASNEILAVADEVIFDMKKAHASLPDNIRYEFGGARLRAPFTVKSRGETHVVLPRGVTNLSRPELKALLRHELAHVAAGDIVLTWLSAGWWVALLPVLLLPLVVAAAQGGFVSITTPGEFYLSWETYARQAFVLSALAALTSFALLRSREHDADLTGCACDRAAMIALLHHPPSSRFIRWRAAVRIHPPPERRREMVARPELWGRALIVDLAVVAFATTLTTGVSVTLGTQLELALSPYYQFGLVSMVQGITLGLAWALPIWRRFWVYQLMTGTRQMGPELVSVFTLALGVLLGLLIAETYQRPAMLVAAPLTAAGAATISLAVARWWILGRSPTLVSWGVVGVFNVLLFASAYWFGMNMSTVASDETLIDTYWNAALVPAVFGGQAILFVALGVIAAVWTFLRRHHLNLGLPARWMLLTVVATATAMVASHFLGGVSSGASATAYQIVAASLAAGIACFTVIAIVGGSDAVGPALASATATVLLVDLSIGIEYAASVTNFLYAQSFLGLIVFSSLGPAVLLLALSGLLMPNWRDLRFRRVPWMAPILASSFALFLGGIVPPPSYVQSSGIPSAVVMLDSRSGSRG